jgi:hypothetical protein
MDGVYPWGIYGFLRDYRPARLDARVCRLVEEIMKKLARYFLCSDCSRLTRWIMCFFFGCIAYDEMCNRIDRELRRARI